MHATLLAIIQRTDINATTKSLAALVYAHTNGTGYAEIPLDQVVEALGVGEHKLRTYRAALHRLGFMDSSVSEGALIVDVNLQWHASAPCGRAPEAQRAASARCAPEEAPTSAPSGRATDDQRAEAARTAPDPETACTPCGRAADDQRAEVARIDEHRAEGARSTAKSAPSRRASPPTPPVRVGGLINLTLSREENPPTPGKGGAGGKPAAWDPAEHLPDGPVSDAPPAPGEAARTAAMLTAAGLSAIQAERLAQVHGFWYCLAIAAEFEAEQRAGKAIGPGVLSYRIKSGTSAPALDEEGPWYIAHVYAGDRNRALVARYRVPPELAHIIKS